MNDAHGAQLRRWACATALVVGGAAPACRGRDLPLDCPDYGAAYHGFVELEAQMFTEAGTKPPFPVALVFSSQGLSDIFGAEIAASVPFGGSLEAGPSTVGFELDGPAIVSIPPDGVCARCLSVAVEFDVDVQSGSQPVTAGKGDAIILVPIRLDDLGDGQTALVAEYGALELSQMHVSAFGLDSEDHEVWQEALRILMEEEFRASYGDTVLMRFETWNVAGGEVILAPRELWTSAETQTAAIVMDSNLPRTDSTFDPLAATAPGVPLTLRVAPELMLGIGRRALSNGTLARRYDEDAEPDDKGPIGVTLHGLRGSEAGNPWLDLEFRVWRILDGYCGYVSARMDMFVTLGPSGLELEPGDPTVISGVGSGALADDESMVIQENRPIAQNLGGQLADELEVALDYDSFELEAKLLYIAPIGFAVHPDVVETHFSALVLAP